MTTSIGSRVKLQYTVKIWWEQNLYYRGGLFTVQLLHGYLLHGYVPAESMQQSDGGTAGEKKTSLNIQDTSNLAPKYATWWEVVFIQLCSPNSMHMAYAWGIHTVPGHMARERGSGHQTGCCKGHLAHP